MSTADVRKIIRAPGRLCYGPTDLSTAFPHGGTAIGMCRDMIFNFGVKTLIDEAEEWGGVTSKAYYAGEKPFMSCVLRDFDNDWISSVFPNSSAGASSGDRVVNFSPGVAGQNRPGYDLTGKQVKLCFSPKSTARHPFVILYYAIPAIEETASFQMALSEEIGIPAAFWAGIDGTGRCYAIGKSEDITL